MTELLPAELDKSGFYWITFNPSDHSPEDLWRWDAEQRCWMDEDVRHWPAEAYADGWRLAWPDPLPTVEQLKEMQPLTERQPIATAPMDGTAVDLWEQYTNDGKLTWMRWPDCKWIDGKWQRIDWDIGDYIENPGCTHWTAIVT